MPWTARSAPSTGRWRVRLALGLLAVVIALRATSVAEAQAVFLTGPAGELSSVTPRLQLVVAGLGPARPFITQVQVSTTADFVGLVVDSTFQHTDSIIYVQITRPLPSETRVYWRARVRAFAGPVYESIPEGPRLAPVWLQLLTPNSITGNSFDIRRPLFVWRSPSVIAGVGPFKYDVDIQTNGRTEVSVVGLTDTTFRPATDLQANTSYRWTVRASLPNGESVRVSSLGSFVITDPPLPTTTLLFQNFPNPFPSLSSYSTCFWFDVGEGGATIRLEVLDLRGNLVRNIVPGSDGITHFDTGRYGRGAPGANSNCDNRFVWDGTANDGHVVAPGIYLARFSANNGAPTFRRMLFKGR